MKVAISAENNQLESLLDLKFGRAKGFIIYDIDNDEFDFIDNEKNFNAIQGAGIQAAQMIVDNDVDAIITGYCGPKAYAVLEVAEIKIFVGEKDTIINNIKKFKNNELKEQEKDF